MTWSGRDEAVYQLRRRRKRVLQQLMVVTLLHAIAAIVLETYTRHHRALHVVTVLAFIASLAGLGSVAVLGVRWGLTSNAAESWSDTERGSAGRKARRARRQQAVRAVRQDSLAGSQDSRTEREASRARWEEFRAGRQEFGVTRRDSVRR
jgi:hypothetical protein